MDSYAIVVTINGSPGMRKIILKYALNVKVLIGTDQGRKNEQKRIDLSLIKNITKPVSDKAPRQNGENGYRDNRNDGFGRRF